MATDTSSGFMNSWFTNTWFANTWFANIRFTNTGLAKPWGRRTRAFWERLARWGRRAPRSLRLRESLPLGEHRFVAVIEFEGARLLIGGTPSSLVLLARLGAGPAAPSEAHPPEVAEANSDRAQAEDFQLIGRMEKRNRDAF
jgi:Flagellar biosynthesis protein, FliO